MTSAYEPGAVPEITVAHRLRIAREHVGLEQAELAERMGVSRTTVSNAESGKHHPRKILINAWSMATGVPVEWLKHGKQQSPRPEYDPDGGNDVRPGGFEPPTF